MAAATQGATDEVKAFPGVPPGLPAEEVPTDTLGVVVVRASLLSEKLADDMNQAAASKAATAGGTTEREAAMQTTMVRTLATLARQVLGADGKPLKTAEQWDVHGAVHQADVLKLFNVIGRLSGGRDAEKN
ncbi:MAG: hypothetical protein EOO29_08375 [Comamonadaceae bacterium]|nr:MAG: hypothetical protein EOO29_08375 [Comamonadaceae bacterium]